MLKRPINSFSSFLLCISNKSANVVVAKLSISPYLCILWDLFQANMPLKDMTINVWVVLRSTQLKDMVPPLWKIVQVRNSTESASGDSRSFWIKGCHGNVGKVCCVIKTSVVNLDLLTNLFQYSFFDNQFNLACYAEEWNLLWQQFRNLCVLCHITVLTVLKHKGWISKRNKYF